MDSKSPIERLREMLNERNVKWWEDHHDGEAFTCWKSPIFGTVEAMDNEDGETLFIVCLTEYDFTPEAAVIATLGREEYETYRDEYGVWHCPSCEKGGDKITSRNGAIESWIDSWPPNFCPNCGVKLKAANGQGGK